MPWSTRRKRSSLQNERSLDQGSQTSSQNTSKNLDDGSVLDSSPFQQDFQLESTPKQSGEQSSQILEPTQKVYNSQPLDRSVIDEDDNSNEVIAPTQIVESTQITANILSPISSEDESNNEVLPTQIVASSQAPDSCSPEDNSILPTQIVNNNGHSQYEDDQVEEEEEYLVSTQPPPGANMYPPTQIILSPAEEDFTIDPSQDVDACVNNISPNKRPRMTPPSDTDDNHNTSVDIVSSKPLPSHHKNLPSDEVTNGKHLQCGICLEDISELGEMDSGCGHSFCFPCIVEWSRVTNLCAMCKKDFKSITKINVRDSTKGETVKVTPKKQRIHDDDDFYFDDEEEGSQSDSLSQESDYDPDVYDINDHDADYQPDMDNENTHVTPRRRTRASRRSRGTAPRNQNTTSNNTPVIASQSNMVTPPRGVVWVPPTIGYSPVSTPPLTPVHPRHLPFPRLGGALPSPIPRSLQSPSLDTSLISTPKAKTATPPEVPSPTLSPEIISTNKSRNLEPTTTISPSVSPTVTRVSTQEPATPPSPQDRLDTSTDVLNFDFRNTRPSNTNNRTTPTLNNNTNNNTNRSNNSNNNNTQDTFSTQPVKQPGRLTVKAGSFPASFLRTQSTLQTSKENDSKTMKKVWKEFDHIMKQKENQKKSDNNSKSQPLLKKAPSDPSKKDHKVFDLNTKRFNNKKGQ